MQDYKQPMIVPTIARATPPVNLAERERGHGSEDFETRDLERDAWWRTMSASVAFVKWTHLRLLEAEAKLAEQDKRIAALELLSTQDELTGLLNRRGFFDAFGKEMDRAKRGLSEGGLLIMIDLDNFKMINDTYGHPAGDAALRIVAKTLMHNSRVMDSCARLGGDEFVLLLANTERDKSLARAQNLIKQLNSLSLIWYGAELPIRASLGLKNYTSSDHAEDIFGAADGKLYESKRINKGFYPAITNAGL